MIRRWVAGLAALGLAVAGVTLVAPLASAATATCSVVDTNSDQNFVDLQTAVNAAAASDELVVSGTCTGTTRISEDVTLAGHGASPTLNGALRIGPDTSVTVDNLIITNGHGGDYAADVIGSLFGPPEVAMANSRLTLNHSSLTGNSGAFEGGGILLWPGTTLILNGRSTVTGNTGGFGGGIYNWGTVILNDGSGVTGNTSGDYGGGGIYNHGGTVTLNDGSTVSNNSAYDGGGGIFSADGGTVTMNGGSKVIGNTAVHGPGGGIYNISGTMVGVVCGRNVRNNTPNNITDTNTNVC